MFEEIANLSGSTINCTTNDVVANLKVSTGSRLKGEGRVDRWSEYVPRLTDTW